MDISFDHDFLRTNPTKKGYALQFDFNISPGATFSLHLPEEMTLRQTAKTIQGLSQLMFDRADKLGW